MSDQKESGNFKNSVELVLVFIALLTVIVALSQYISSQKWERSKFAAKYLDKRNTIEEVYLAERKILDWRYNDFKAPKRMGLKDKTINYNQKLLESSLNTKDNKKIYTEDEEVIVHIIDTYFDYIEETYHFINIDLFEITDVQGLCYYAEKTESKNSVIFQEYIEKYEFDDVRKFIALCKKNDIEKHNKKHASSIY